VTEHFHGDLGRRPAFVAVIGTSKIRIEPGSTYQPGPSFREPGGGGSTNACHCCDFLGRKSPNWTADLHLSESEPLLKMTQLPDFRAEGFEAVLIRPMQPADQRQSAITALR